MQNKITIIGLSFITGSEISDRINLARKVTEKKKVSPILKPLLGELFAE